MSKILFESEFELLRKDGRPNIIRILIDKASSNNQTSRRLLSFGILMLGTSCLKDKQLLLTNSNLDDFLQHYVFPVQFILGVAGNSTNLIVLLSKGMRSKTNSLLSAMAFADLALLFCMLPHSLASFEIAYRSYTFRYFYYVSKRQLNAFANFFSAAATWLVHHLLVLTLSVERFIGIRSPVHAHFKWKEKGVLLIIVPIFIGAFVITFYHHIAYKYSIYTVCNGTQLKGNVRPIDYNWTGNRLYGNALTKYIYYGKYLQLITVILVPIVAVAFLNVSLICLMRDRVVVQRNRSTSNNSDYSMLRNCNDTGIMQRQERKVTVTVLAIVTCFTITHAPSLVPFVWETLGISKENPRPFLATVSIANSLLITGKVLNFVLFCSSSVHFRRRLMHILLSHLMRRSESRKLKKVSISQLKNSVPIPPTRKPSTSLSRRSIQWQDSAGSKFLAEEKN
uniref:G-protein coupled receptors family 1 profile domain-containing protein n=1 Tax=Setaria digitata TaxID=48799 RepID=A0A915PPP0_9BILA